MNKKLVELDKYEQQIILACKNHSKLNLNKYEKVKNAISHMLGLKATDESMYYWLYKIISRVDKELDLNYRNLIVETMFSKDWLMANSTKIETMTMEDMNKKFISMIMSFEVIDNGFGLLHLEEDNSILNTLFNDNEDGITNATLLDKIETCKTIQELDGMRLDIIRISTEEFGTYADAFTKKKKQLEKELYKL